MLLLVGTGPSFSMGIPGMPDSLMDDWFVTDFSLFRTNCGDDAEDLVESDSSSDYVGLWLFFGAFLEGILILCSIFIFLTDTYFHSFYSFYLFLLI